MKSDHLKLAMLNFPMPPPATPATVVATALNTSCSSANCVLMAVMTGVILPCMACMPAIKADPTGVPLNWPHHSLTQARILPFWITNQTCNQALKISNWPWKALKSPVVNPVSSVLHRRGMATANSSTRLRMPRKSAVQAARTTPTAAPAAPKASTSGTH